MCLNCGLNWSQVFSITETTKRAGTAAAYQMSLTPVTRILSPKHVADVATIAALEKFVQSRSGEVALRRPTKNLRTLRAALRYAEKKGYTLKSPSLTDAWCKTNEKDRLFSRRRCSRNCWRLPVVMISYLTQLRGSGGECSCCWHVIQVHGVASCWG